MNLRLLSESLDDFLFRQVPRIVALPREDVKWHFNPLCAVCPYKSSCRGRAVAEGRIGSIPNISLDDEHMLQGLLAIARGTGHKTTDIEDLHLLIEDARRFQLAEVTYPSTIKKAKRILALPLRRNIRDTLRSPIVEAARTRSLKVTMMVIYIAESHSNTSIL